MCESIVYSVGKPDKPLMKDVVLVTVEGDRIKLRDVLGVEKTTNGEIVKIDLVNHSLLIKER